MIVITHRGNFERTRRFFKHISNYSIRRILRKYGEQGVEALANMTPVGTGKTASSWYYDIEVGRNSASIIWGNSNSNKGVNIAIILQLGHGTGTGGYVKGVDYISPATEPIFEAIAAEAWKEVTSG